MEVGASILKVCIKYIQVPVTHRCVKERDNRVLEFLHARHLLVCDEGDHRVSKDHVDPDDDEVFDVGEHGQDRADCRPQPLRDLV